MAGLAKSPDLAIEPSDSHAADIPRIHINDLPDPPSHWRAMERHPHGEGFRKAAQLEYDALEKKETWKIIDRPEGAEIIPVKWMFTYKTDPDGYLMKYKARIVVRDDLQFSNVEDVYAATLASKVFRVLMALVAAFDLQTRQLNAVNAFLNAENDENVYCHMPDEYRLKGKVLKLIKVLYDQRKSPLLWLRILTSKCIDLGLIPVPEESCLFTDKKGLFMFFYVDDIVFAFPKHRKRVAEALIERLKAMFECRDLGEVKFFLGVRVIKTVNFIYLIQNAYVDKLVKEYEIKMRGKIQTPLSYLSNLKPFEGEIDLSLLHEYRKKVESICYSATITRPDIAKAVSKLAQFLINSDPNHLFGCGSLYSLPSCNEISRD
jgi:hypothetical protein